MSSKSHRPKSFVPQQSALTYPGKLENLPTSVGEAPGGGNSMVRDWVAREHQGPYDSTYGQAATDPLLKVPKGQLTFDAEGTEGGKYHSRTPHWPGGGSGVTLGRGYDLGQGRSKASIREDLTAAGLSEADANTYAGAAHKRGSKARNHMRRNRGSMPEITKEQQKALFATTYEDEASEVRRISEKSSTRRAYGDFDLDAADPAVGDLMVDLKYRGDYTPNSRKRVQSMAANGDLSGLADDLGNRRNWRSVPKDRFERRKAYAREAVEERAIEKSLGTTFAAPLEHMGSPDYDLWGRRKSNEGAD